MTRERTSLNQYGSLLTEEDIYYFKQGTHYRLYEKLGSHLVQFKGTKAFISPYGRPTPKAFPS